MDPVNERKLHFKEMSKKKKYQKQLEMILRILLINHFYKHLKLNLNVKMADLSKF